MLVLLIACANVANLLLMRAVYRAREIAMRASLGASRLRVLRQLMVESTLLAMCGGPLGLGLTLLGLQILGGMLPTNDLPFWWDFTLNTRILALLAAICLGTAFVFGLMPAMNLSRTGLLAAMKGGGQGAVGGQRRRLTTVFLACQFAAALLLLATLSHGLREARAQERKDAAIDMTRLLTASLTMPSSAYPTPEARVALLDRLTTRLNAAPSVAEAALATALPFGGAPARPLVIDGAPVPSGASPTVWTVGIGERYFQALEVPVVRGRGFGPRDGTPGYETAIVNEPLVNLHFPDTDPLGRRIALGTDADPEAPPVWLTIVGVAPTIRQRGRAEPDPVVYLPLRADPPATATIIVRGASEADSPGPILREGIRRLDPNLPLYRMQTMEQAVNDLRWNGRVSNVLLTTITLIAVLLAAVGITASTSHRVAVRMSELGIRVAIGARPHHLAWSVLKPSLAHLGIGLCFGVIAAVAWERLFAGFAAPGTISHPVTLSAATAFLAAVATAACLWPVRRAVHLDPLVVLREE